MCARYLYRWVHPVSWHINDYNNVAIEQCFKSIMMLQNLRQQNEILTFTEPRRIYRYISTWPRTIRGSISAFGDHFRPRAYLTSSEIRTSSFGIMSVTPDYPDQVWLHITIFPKKTWRLLITVDVNNGSVVWPSSINLLLGVSCYGAPNTITKFAPATTATKELLWLGHPAASEVTFCCVLIHAVLLSK